LINFNRIELRDCGGLEAVEGLCGSPHTDLAEAALLALNNLREYGKETISSFVFKSFIMEKNKTSRFTC